jgi:hypothetical protein
MKKEKNNPVAESKFNNSGFNYRDLDRLLTTPMEKRYYNYNKKTKEIVDRESEATVIQYTSRFDSTYILYTYIVDGKEYAFLWETYYDETHRAYSKNSKSEWYDDVHQENAFKIEYASADPKKHYVVDKNLKFDGALFAGKK